MTENLGSKLSNAEGFKKEILEEEQVWYFIIRQSDQYPLCGVNKATALLVFKKFSNYSEDRALL